MLIFTIKMDYRLFITARYLGKKGKEPFIYFSTLVSILGIAIGVAALILVLGVMNGFDSNLKEKIAGSSPNIIISQTGTIADYERIIEKIKGHLDGELVGISPFIETQAILQSQNAFLGGIVKGIDPEREILVTNIGDWVKNGLKISENEIILGKEVARALKVKKGEEITLINGLSGRKSNFIVGGIFESGLYPADSGYSFICLKRAQRDFALPGMVSGIGLKVKNLLKSESMASSLSWFLGGDWTTRSWLKENKVLFSAIALEKRVMTIILTLIILVAAFNIASSLMTMVYKKIKDIGILKSLGVSKRDIRAIFILKGLFTSLIGVGMGLAIGLLGSFLLEKYQFIKLPPFIYDLSYLPVKVENGDLIIIAAGTFLITFLATLYPAWRAGRLEPAEALRYE
ncbi:MAG: lipoprotein-releasing system transmembrane subunit LolC [bacterium (Candidatus Ratteibacteria) CG_4_9_14_3_um_filter_41_21]|uniref:Lipoprotein-releasing system transmembrane subunit LolC n=2 Tax=Candidatus Ratteibacteria TaxID=2979319 RepID=A0A2M7YFM7_9BACT|nr:MAG: lipoprotein-releasing system transmembrane subunit LolC [bacterium (Candidatus Ratteibacteria) CG15_BIG_FIL_POST_REV_8_21_14_020_41_12]PJA61772.1 MAG: lipoprotein-releasing system transmembrane subunit LolC [bacterium (Candidatus Ratteibacteria) CG_4_9_14_3_um_filter_41_21]